MATAEKTQFGYVLELLNNNEDARAVEEIKLHGQDKNAPGGRMWWQRMEVLMEYGKRVDVIEHLKIVDQRVREELESVGMVNAKEYTS